MAISIREKLFGIGPIGAVVSFVMLVIAVWVNRAMGNAAILSNPAPLKWIGIALVVIGFGLHLWSMSTLRNWWTREELCTTGPFKWFRHPLYAAWITFILPGVSLYLNSWIILLSVVLLHPVWHKLVVREEKMMAGQFQDEYQVYAEQTGRFFPRLWKR